jgi:hypothetical protein
LIPSGYSISSGKFLGEKNKTYYVSGAPRAGKEYQGKVTSQFHGVTAPISPFISLLSNVALRDHSPRKNDFMEKCVVFSLKSI